MVLNRKTPIFIATLLIAISCGQAKDLKSSNPSKAGFDEERLKRIDTMIQGCVDSKEVHGAERKLNLDGKICNLKAID